MRVFPNGAGLSVALAAVFIAAWFSPGFGLEGGPLLTARYDFRMALEDSVIEELLFSLAWNDPDQLVIFPFARDSLSLNYSLIGQF